MKDKRRKTTMFAQEPKGRPEATFQQRTATSKGESAHVAEARVQAQHAKLEMQEQEPIQQHVESTHQQAKGNRMQRDLQAQPSVMTTVARAIEDYLQDHQAGNHSAKTLEWHQIALGLIQTYLEQECEITLIDEIKSSDISGWFAHMRTIPGKHGKPRAEHTIQTYARSARAFFHWLIRRHIIESNPFDGVTFPKVGKRQIETVELEEFEQLLLACAPPNEPGPLAQRAAARNRAIFWLFYNTGIRVSELCSLKVDDVDRKHAMITIRSKGSKERRIALGKSCLSSLLHYLDRHRSDKQEQAEWDSAGEDHLFLSETQTPLTENGVEMLFGSGKRGKVLVDLDVEIR
jgi:site-specific recombinase XerD